MGVVVVTSSEEGKARGVLSVLGRVLEVAALSRYYCWPASQHSTCAWRPRTMSLCAAQLAASSTWSPVTPSHRAHISPLAGSGFLGRLASGFWNELLPTPTPGCCRPAPSPPGRSPRSPGSRPRAATASGGYWRPPPPGTCPREAESAASRPVEGNARQQRVGSVHAVEATRAFEHTILSTQTGLTRAAEASFSEALI